MTWDIPIDEALEIAGNAHLRAEVIATCPHPILAVRLCDVAPDGTSTPVTRGTLLIGPAGDVDVELEATAWRWLPGRILRVSVAGADWPNVVAPGGPGTLTLRGATLTVPRYEPDGTMADPSFAPGRPESSEDPAGSTWQIERDVARGVTRAVVGSESTYQTPYGSARERYDGWVSVDTRSFQQHAHADVEFTLHFDEVVATAHSVMDLCTEVDAYRLRIQLTVRDGEGASRAILGSTVPARLRQHPRTPARQVQGVRHAYRCGRIPPWRQPSPASTTPRSSTSCASARCCARSGPAWADSTNSA
jgi:hypothetical protein